MKVELPTSFHVLIIDDNEKDVALIARHLRKRWSMLVLKRVDDAAAMRKLLEEQTWDCILCDMAMPEFSAAAALEIIKQSKLFIPFIVISGVATIEGALSLLRTGADDFVRKAHLSRLAPAIERATREVVVRQTKDEAERNLTESEARFRGLFEKSDISLWSENLSEVYTTLNNLKVDNVQELRQYLNSNDKQAARELALMVQVQHVNEATLKLFAAKTEDMFLSQVTNTFASGSMSVFIDELCAIWDKQTKFQSEANFKTLDGRQIKAIISLPIPATEEGFRNIPVSIIDITESERTKSQLRESERQSRAWLEHSPVCTKIVDLDFNLQYETSA